MSTAEIRTPLVVFEGPLYDMKVYKRTFSSNDINL